jgi:hypothetical protein
MFRNAMTSERLSAEHTGISASLRHLVDLVNQQFDVAERTRTSKVPLATLKSLEEKWFNAGENITSLEEALQNHYGNEREFLRPLLGSLLKQAIAKETLAILGQFTPLKGKIVSGAFNESNREQALVKIVDIKQSVERLSQQVETHATKMDGVLKLLETILGSEKP